MSSRRNRNKNRVVPVGDGKSFRLVRNTILARRTVHDRYKLYGVDSRAGNNEITDYFEDRKKYTVTAYLCIILASMSVYAVIGSVEDWVMRLLLSGVLGVSFTMIIFRFFKERIDKKRDALGLTDYYLLVKGKHLDSTDDTITSKLISENHKLDVTDLVIE